MNEAKSFLIGPFGLAVAALTVVAFVTSMLLSSRTSAAQAAGGGSAHSRPPRRASTLTRVASARWPLAVLMVLITAYRIYALS